MHVFDIKNWISFFSIPYFSVLPSNWHYFGCHWVSFSWNIMISDRFSVRTFVDAILLPGGQVTAIHCWMHHLFAMSLLWLGHFRLFSKNCSYLMVLVLLGNFQNFRKNKNIHNNPGTILQHIVDLLSEPTGQPHLCGVWLLVFQQFCRRNQRTVNGHWNNCPEKTVTVPFFETMVKEERFSPNFCFRLKKREKVCSFQAFLRSLIEINWNVSRHFSRGGVIRWMKQRSLPVAQCQTLWPKVKLPLFEVRVKVKLWSW